MKVGDIVHVRGKVCDKSKTGEGIEIDFGPCTPGTWVNPMTIVHIEPPPIKVGDTVRYRSMDWTVIGIDGELLWIKTNAKFGVDHASVHRDEIQRYS